MIGLMNIVRSRFHIPAAMLDRILAESDPVVTCHDDRLRLEGFSACCGAYARMDLLPSAFENSAFENAGNEKGFAGAHTRGTTNVDFSEPMLAALSKVREGDKVSLFVGSDEVMLEKAVDESQPTSKIIEKRVRLPDRWLRGFVEVQSVQARMRAVYRTSAIQAYRFLRSLPRMKTNRRATWVVRKGDGLRLTQVETTDGVRVGGLERLRVLETLARDAQTLDIYADPRTGASAWVVHYPECRFHLVISPEVWRGFTGEGQALEALVKPTADILASVRARLRWQSVIDSGDLAEQLNVPIESVDRALQVLGTRGVVGFDAIEQKYFHRELPFDLSTIEKQQPRLIAARKLIDLDQVRVVNRTNERIELTVATDVQHRVSLMIDGDENWRCTCPWFNKHQGDRGPCKHILAAQIHLQESQTGTP